MSSNKKAEGGVCSAPLLNLHPHRRLRRRQDQEGKLFACGFPRIAYSKHLINQIRSLRLHEHVLDGPNSSDIVGFVKDLRRLMPLGKPIVKSNAGLDKPEETNHGYGRGEDSSGVGAMSRSALLRLLKLQPYERSQRDG